MVTASGRQFSGFSLRDGRVLDDDKGKHNLVEVVQKLDGGDFAGFESYGSAVVEIYFHLGIGEVAENVGPVEALEVGGFDPFVGQVEHDLAKALDVISGKKRKKIK